MGYSRSRGISSSEVVEVARVVNVRLVDLDVNKCDHLKLVYLAPSLSPCANLLDDKHKFTYFWGYALKAIAAL